MQIGLKMIKKEFITHRREPFYQLAKNVIKKEDKILDIGAGNGSFAQFCDRKDMYLYDGNKESIASLKNRFPNVFHGKLPQLPFENNLFDVIHLSHIVEHLPPEALYQTLKECDRCLRAFGRLIISAPLLWEGFYDDLSHVKPYNPYIFQKYLCGSNKENLTRQSISDSYKVEELVYRLKEKEWVKNLKRSKKFKVLDKVYSNFRPFGFERYNRTGYTIVLKKKF